MKNRVAKQMKWRRAKKPGPDEPAPRCTCCCRSPDYHHPNTGTPRCTRRTDSSSSNSRYQTRYATCPCHCNGLLGLQPPWTAYVRIYTVDSIHHVTTRTNPSIPRQWPTQLWQQWQYPLPQRCSFQNSPTLQGVFHLRNFGTLLPRLQSGFGV